MKDNLIKIITDLMIEEGLDMVQISNDSVLLDDLNLDSLMLAVLTVKIKEEFGVDIFEHNFPKTFGDILNILENV